MKQAINTRTQEEYDALMRHYEAKGIEWSHFGKATSCPDWWDEDKEETCVSVDSRPFLVYAPISYWRNEGYSIIPYTEFAKTIKPEIDYKALYLEGRELLEEVRGYMTAHIPEKAHDKVDQFLTNHKDGD